MQSSRSREAESTATTALDTEAKEMKRGGSWIKSIGMRTLRLRKGDKKPSIVMDEDVETKPRSAEAGSVPPSPSVSKQTQALPALPVEQGAVSPSKTHVGRGQKSRAGGPATGSIPPEKTPANASSASAPQATAADKADPARFIGDGLSFKAKLIGILEVSGPRGDRICQEALSELKMAVKAAGEHKQKVTVHVALDGLRIRDEKTADCLYHHQVHKISFIAQDLTDTRAFGYIFGSPDTGHRFFGIKTEKSASQVVMAMRDLFQVVFDLKKKEIERAKQQLEMQQKFLATRAAETAPRTFHKSGIAETYIEGACALGGRSSPRNAPAEADLLNLEVELTSLQEGLDHLHSTLIDTAQAHAPFNRGSTASISSDPLNPMPPSFKYSAPPAHASFNHQPAASQLSSGGRAQPSPVLLDPFGDSFDPFESSGRNGHGITSPGFPTDPFSNVDPFPTLNSSAEFLASDPFDANAFVFPDAKRNSTSSVGGSQAQTSSLASDKVLPPAPARDSALPPPSLSSSSAPSVSNVSTLDKRPEALNASVARGGAPSWRASFEDNFVPESTALSNGLSTNLDIFTELDPLGTGRVRPFVDRKDFFNDLKNPTKKLMVGELNAPSSLPPLEQSLLPPKKDQLSLDAETALPNSFSTNFAPSTAPSTTDVDPHFPHQNDLPLRTSSIRVQPGGLATGDSPPSYSPPPPPPGAAAVSNSVYFVSPIPRPVSSTTSRASSKKSPQLLRNMTISSTQSQDASPHTLPRSLMRLGKMQTLGSAGDEIPSLTPPPPHSASSTLTRNATLSSALPRPHSGNEARRQQSLQLSSSSGQPPEPPPRPLASTMLSNSPAVPLVSPPPLPPKKQSVPCYPSPAQLTKVLYSRDAVSRNLSSADGSANDLPLPVPQRKAGLSESTTGRYAFPVEDTTGSRAEPSSRSKLSQLPEMSLDVALKQVAALSLGELATKLQLPVLDLSTCTIQELAMKLTLLDLEKQKKDVEAKLAGRRVESSFAARTARVEDEDFSTVSAPAAAVFQTEPPLQSTQRQCHVDRSEARRELKVDRYAVFRELTLEDASGFSILSPPAQDASEEEDDVPGSKTLTSRESSSEKTLQADVDGPGQGLSTMDDVTDVNFSEDEKSGLFDEVVELSSKDWATFESNLDEQFIPLARTFGSNKSEESPWDSDSPERPQFRPTQTTLQSDCTAHRSPKLPPAEASQFDFQPFQKPALEPARRRHSREHDAQREQDSLDARFQRQSSGSSRHSDRSGTGRKGLNTTSDYSDSGRDKPARRRSSRDWDEKRSGRADSRNSYSSATGRRYSRDSDDYARPGSRRQREPYYYDDEDDDRSYASTRSNCSTTRKTQHTPSHRRHPPTKHRDGRRRPDSPDSYSNHESDGEDSFGEHGGRRRAYPSRDKELRPSSRPPSGSKRHSHRDDYYRDRPRREHHYHHRYRREEDVREASDGSAEETSGQRRSRGRRAPREKASAAYDYNSNSPSWDSESPREDWQQPFRRGGTQRHSERDSRGEAVRSSRYRREEDSEQSLPKPRLSAEFRLEEELSAANARHRPESGPPSTETLSNHGSGRSSCRLPAEQCLDVRKPSSERPPESPFEDNFVLAEANGATQLDDDSSVFFSAAFEPESLEKLESGLSLGKGGLSAASPKELGRVIEEEPSSPERERAVSQKSEPASPRNKESMTAICEAEMKKSDSFNIFQSGKDPFADDDFFV